MTNDYLEISGGEAAKIVELAGGIVLDGIDGAKRRKFDKAFNAMDDAQQEEFAKKMLDAQSNQAKLKLITDAILEERKNRLEASSRRMRNVALVVIGSGVLLIGVAALLKARK